ncbi:hypothetical protein BURPS305_6594 [Burkholderia pseudomallei 305]|nr:hypothetical protein BURPS305_6594 [Burkholderia pseudomallei 305]
MHRRQLIARSKYGSGAWHPVPSDRNMECALRDIEPRET